MGGEDEVGGEDEGEEDEAGGEENRRPCKGLNSKVCHQPILLYQYYIYYYQIKNCKVTINLAEHHHTSYNIIFIVSLNYYSCALCTAIFITIIIISLDILPQQRYVTRALK